MNRNFIAFLAVLAGIAMMLTSVGCATTAVPGNQLIAYNPDKSEAVILHDTPCVNDAALAPVKPEYRSNFEKAASYIGFKGLNIAGCYWIFTHGASVAVITVWEDGDTIPLHPSQFEPLVGKPQLKAKGTGI